jgi:hypothetical protein
LELGKYIENLLMNLKAFDFQIGAVSDDIKFTVRDDDVTTTEIVGSVSLKCSSLCYNNGVRDWVSHKF